MKKFIAVLLLSYCGMLSAQNLVIKNANIVDVENGKILAAQNVLIENGVIQNISSKKAKNKQGYSEIEANGKYLMPGMIDTHIHFFQTGSLYTRPDAINLTDAKPYEEELEFAMDMTTDSFKRYLSLGVTTVIDVGGPLSNFKVRDSVAKENLSPNVLVTGPLFSPYQPEALSKIDDVPIEKITSIEEADTLFEKMLPYKPDFIKIWYIASTNEPAEKNYPIIEHIAKRTHAAGLKLAVHATQLNTAQLAVNAGADILVHSVDDTKVNEEFITSLLTNNVTYIPTLIVSKNYAKAFLSQPGDHPQDLAYANPKVYGSLTDLKSFPQEKLPDVVRNLSSRPQAVFDYYDKIVDLMNENLKLLSDRGVNIAAGTDAGNIGTMHASSYIQELEAMKKSGISESEIIKSATINAAKGFGIETEVGSVSKGKNADLVLLDGNPLEDLSALNSITEVIKDGEILNRKDMMKETPEQVVQRQLIAYNAGNIEAFLDTFSDDVELFEFPEKPLMNGKNELRKVYGKKFDENPKLYSEVKNRTVMGNKVIDVEYITTNSDPYSVIAIYEVNDGKITKATFVK